MVKTFVWIRNGILICLKGIIKVLVVSKYSNGLLGITNFFKVKQTKEKFVKGWLTDEETRNYLKRVSLVTLFGGAPCVELSCKRNIS